MSLTLYAPERNTGTFSNCTTITEKCFMFNNKQPFPGAQFPCRMRCRTLQDAADHILKLPKAQQQLSHWQAAAEKLIMARRAFDLLPANASPARID